MKTDSRNRVILAALLASVLGLCLSVAPGCGGGDPAGSSATTITDPTLKEESKEGITPPPKAPKKGGARK